ncbi:MAG: type II secretion system F family protein [Candidatus Pacebacteria bacterium]|nr:type II secretion system F family protein [Candidatus Paceibacterota bacterium]
MKTPSALTKFTQNVSFQEKLFFTKHLSTMIKAGIPIGEAMESLTEQGKNGVMKKVLGEVYDKVKNGETLAKALGEYPHIFDDFYVSLIKVGEESGTLEESLVFLSKQLGKDYALKQKIQGAMMYPGLVFFATTVMGGYISLFVLPQLVGFFDAFDFELPLATRILLLIANTMKSYGVMIMGSLIALFFLTSLFVQLRPIKIHWDKFLLKIPLFGTMIKYGQLARFTRNFGVLIQAGLPINRSLEVTANTLSNLQFNIHVMELSANLKKGKNISDILEDKKYPEFPTLISKMVGVGEKTGKLDETLIYLGDFYEDEIDNISKSLTTVLEPIMLLGIGLVVAFVAFAIISPIYELTGSIRR